MPTDIDPIIDNWYFHLDKGQRFYVVDVDDIEETVEIQHFDGDLEEISFGDWYEMNIAVGEEPENWSGALDVSERDDLGTEITDTRPVDWSEALSDFRKPDKESGTVESEES